MPTQSTTTPIRNGRLPRRQAPRRAARAAATIARAARIRGDSELMLGHPHPAAPTATPRGAPSTSIVASVRPARGRAATPCRPACSPPKALRGRGDPARDRDRRAPAEQAPAPRVEGHHPVLHAVGDPDPSGRHGSTDVGRSPARSSPGSRRCARRAATSAGPAHRRAPTATRPHVELTKLHARVLRPCPRLEGKEHLHELAQPPAIRAEPLDGRTSGRPQHSLPRGHGARQQIYPVLPHSGTAS